MSQAALDELRRLLRDESKWLEYLQSLNDLLAHVSGLNNLLRDIKAELNTTLGDIIARNDERLLKIILGGADVRKRTYKPKALGLFHRQLGIGVDDNDLAKFLSRIDMGEAPAEAGKDIKIKLRDTLLTQLLKTLEDRLRLAVEHAGLEPREAHQYDAKDPQALLKALAEILSKTRPLLPLYNKHSFIIQSFNSTPVFYLEKAYEVNLEETGGGLVSITDNTIKKLLDSYNLRFRIVLAPDISNRQERLRKAVISHEEGSLGSEVVNIIGLIYSIHSIISEIQSENSSLLFFNGVEDEYKIYIEKYIPKVENEIKFFMPIGVHSIGTVYSEILKKLKLSYYGSRYNYKILLLEDRVSVMGGQLKIEYGVSFRGRPETVHINIEFTEFLNNFAPLGFLGLGVVLTSPVKIFIQNL